MKKFFGGGHFYEGARWHDGHWWVSDFYAKQVLKIAPDGRAEVAATLENQPSGLGWLPNGDLLIVSMEDRRLLRRRADGSLVVHADLSGLAGAWLNDMVVDSKGRAYVGNFGFDLFSDDPPRQARLVQVDPDGSALIASGELMFPNGSVITGDGKTLIVAESFGNRMTAFTIAEDGSLSDQRIWAQFGPPPSWASLHDMIKVDFAPDGSAIDREDCVWVADAVNNRVCRVRAGGEILQEVKGPENFGTYACALGGPDGRSLLICAAPDFDRDRRRAKPEAVLMMETVAVPIAG